MSFRPGAWRVRICLGTVVTVASAAGCAPAPDRSVKTVEYYRTHAEEREAMLQCCADSPGQLVQSPGCINAQAAARQAGVGSLRDLPPLRLKAPKLPELPAAATPSPDATSARKPVTFETPGG